MKEHIEREKIRRLVKWGNGEPQPPIRIDLEPTHTCNLKCKFCWQRDPYRLGITNYSNALSEERLLKLVDEAAELGVLEWQIAGGWEPMINPEMTMKLLKKIKKNQMFGCITTNGTLINEKRAKELVEMEWDQILFSLEGPDAETHDYLTGIKGSFEKSTNAMRLLREFKKRLNKKAPRFSFHSVITNRNYSKVIELIRLGKELEVEGVGFESLNVWSEEGKKLKLNEDEKKDFLKYVKEAIEVSKKLSVPNTLEKFLETELIDKEKMDKIVKQDAYKSEQERIKRKINNSFFTGACFEPFYSMEIRASGHVVGCRLCDSQDFAPRIQKRPLKEIWYGSYFTKLRKQMVNHNLPKYCSTCAAGIVVDFRKIREELINLEKNPFKKLKYKFLK
jgi:MoaA/NifB/PqqE/SkfB family radical SAM enzyme